VSPPSWAYWVTEAVIVADSGRSWLEARQPGRAHPATARRTAPVRGQPAAQPPAARGLPCPGDAAHRPGRRRCPGNRAGTRASGRA
jgi:hypothetical protein